MRTIYTDGSSRGNPGPGGYAVVVVENDILVAAYSRQEERVTNNQMEMKAILHALEHYGASTQEFFSPVVYSDSQYCVNTFTNWMWKWKQNGWMRPKKQPVENLDLVKRYDALSKDYKIDLRYVKGHSDNVWNNVADQLATGKITAEQAMKMYGGKNESD